MRDAPVETLLILSRKEESEVQVLGSVIQDPSLIIRMNPPGDFTKEKYQEIAKKLLEMHRENIPITIDTLDCEIRKGGKEDKTGGFQTIASLVEWTPSTAGFDYHVKQVREARIKRDVITGLYYAQQKASGDELLENIKADISKLLQSIDSHTERPEMRKEAYYGLAGEIVNFISPHSEADPVALLANFHTAFGNLIGGKAHFQVEATKHNMRLFCVLVGDTSKGRKGTSWDYVGNIFNFLDPKWVENIQTGLSSGEGLIWAVRDEIRKRQPVKERGRVVDYEEIVIDNGVEDKRLLIVEGELASPLRIMERDGNILSPIIRRAWDSGNLQVLTKNSPAKATNAHISIIGHVTRQELIRYLSTTEAGNGFGNRFLWLYVKRSKSLPFGGGFLRVNLEPIIEKLKAAIEFSKDAGEITWAEETRPLWEAVYPKLSEGKPGLIGALTARAEAYVTRLACIYALLDLETAIRPRHLKAAVAFWDYVEDSVRFIFRDSPGVPLVNELRELKGKQGLSKTEIHDHLGRNYSAEEIDRALAFLKEHGEASKKEMKTGRKPKEIWDF